MFILQCLCIASSRLMDSVILYRNLAWRLFCLTAAILHSKILSLSPPVCLSLCLTIYLSLLSGHESACLCRKTNSLLKLLSGRFSSVFLDFQCSTKAWCIFCEARSSSNAFKSSTRKGIGICTSLEAWGQSGVHSEAEVHSVPRIKMWNSFKFLT